ncbi:MAG: gluconate transporter [Bacteroidetes bacterium GWE2_41_25]|nr:MAG: gluconate transporter [Bacteroidetes bacterium GWE2_41_25]HBQ82005.1 gluconate transporter [Bacteroidales bacterium]
MPLLIVICGIALLLLLILVFKLNTFVAFIIVALSVALTVGMTIEEAVASIQKGIGSTMGIIVPVLGFGAMLGKLVSESGAAQRITTRFTGNLNSKYIQTSLMLAGFIVGIALFYEVGFFIMIPLVFTIAASTGLPLIYVGLPMIASLSVTHGYLPPHPAPTALTAMFNADLGLTLLYGLTIAIPAILVSGPLLARFLSRVNAKPLAEFVNYKILTEEEMPGFWTSFFSALLPVILITLSTVAGFIFPEENIIRRILGFVGNPVVAMLLSVLSAIYFLGVARGKKMTDIMKSLSHSISTVAMIMLMIAGAGSLKQILVDGGVSNYIGGLMSHSMLSPLILGWLIATILRICIGSATVSGLTAAGIVLPLVTGTNVSPELMVLAVGSGSLMCSHVNDTGFWLFKEYFSLSVKETLKTWTIMETSIGISGLIGVMILSLIVK